MNASANPTTYSDLAQLRKAAKAANATYPNLTYNQRLNLLAQQRFGVRHFHELQKLYKAHVASHVVLNGMHHCNYCHLNFSDFDAVDRKLHSERHELFEEAELALGFLPMDAKMRGDMKRDFGYEQLYSGDTQAKRLGALAIMVCHYDRSLERAIQGKRWPKHPCLLEYIPCAISNSTFLTNSLQSQLAEEFGLMANVLVSGDTDWPIHKHCDASSGSPKAKASRQLRETILAAYRASQGVVDPLQY